MNKTRHDWRRADAMTNEDIHAAALADPDARPLTPERSVAAGQSDCSETEIQNLLRSSCASFETMKAGGFDIAPNQGNETWTLPIPATFIVGRDGLVNARWIDPDYRKRADLDDILEAVRRSRQPMHSSFQSRIALA